MAVLLGSYGPGSYAEPDPYWDAADWHEAASGDGRGYGGTLATIAPEPGEAQAAVLARADAWAEAYNLGRRDGR